MGLLTRLDQRLEQWRGERANSGESSGAEWGNVLPLLLGAALIAATLVLVVLRFTALGTPQLVAFDVIKYANAQRAVASKFLVNEQAADEVAPLLLNMSKRTREIINEVAGPGTLVVLRQAVVQGEVLDITDEVLTRLNLPTDVPTADPSKLVIDIAPTMLGAGPRMRLPEKQQSSKNTGDNLP